MNNGDSGAVQVTYLPARHCFALWRHPMDPQTRPPGGTTVPIDLAVPGPKNRLEIRSVDAALVHATSAALAEALKQSTANNRAPSASARAWQRILEHLDGTSKRVVVPDPVIESLPLVAHSVPNTGGSAIVTASGAVDALQSSVRMEHAISEAELGFTPRPYQLHGSSWMNTLGEVGGGGILADEMGLGKTLQSIAYMVAGSERGDGPYLVVCPTSLISNWRRELNTFANGLLSVQTYRGTARTLDNSHAPGTVTITGYPTLRTDSAQLAEIHWGSVFFDEAHIMKNSRTKIAVAARSLKADTRIALTGTPVENRMDELWALVDLTNPGLLGTRSRFTRRFSAPIEQQGSQTALAQLSSAIAPVVLRRTKAQVATDLPPKQHIDVLCPITGEQAALYNTALDTAFDTGFGPKSSRGTAVLALLTSLKLICNHPTMVQTDGAELPGRSGKLDRLTEIVEELAESGERGLVFTQYRRTGDMLATHLEAVTGCPIPFFHGGLDVDARDRMVHDFQNSTTSPVMILSLRAAGYGLNLTEASTVVHYDRWWNPAVEAQATDRVHRIGQTSPVTVLTLTTEGTIEEYVASLHNRKKAIAGLTDSNNDTALAALDDVELRSTLSLRTVSA